MVEFTMAYVAGVGVFVLSFCYYYMVVRYYTGCVCAAADTNNIYVHLYVENINDTHFNSLESTCSTQIERKMLEIHLIRFVMLSTFIVRATSSTTSRPLSSYRAKSKVEQGKKDELRERSSKEL